MKILLLPRTKILFPVRMHMLIRYGRTGLRASHKPSISRNAGVKSEGTSPPKTQPGVDRSPSGVRIQEHEAPTRSWKKVPTTASRSSQHQAVSSAAFTYSSPISQVHLIKSPKQAMILPRELPSGTALSRFAEKGVTTSGHHSDAYSTWSPISLQLYASSKRKVLRRNPTSRQLSSALV